jgi:hypothetical protein
MRILIAVPLLFAISAAPVGKRAIGFDHDKSGGVPAGWTVAMTHDGEPPRWEVVPDRAAPSLPNVFAQLSSGKTAGRFPLAIWEGDVVLDGEVSVAFQPIGGEIDQAAGVVWRYRDANHYYVVRANALEHNIAAYKVEGGVRVSIAPAGMASRSYGVKREVLSGVWQTLRVVFRGSTHAIYHDGQKLFEIEDRALQEAGKTGLWTKADSQIRFDNFAVQRFD